MATAGTRWGAPLAVAAALVLLAAGVHRLFALRFESGDILPPYSSFRADPLGTRVLFETLDGHPGWSAGRIVTPADESGVSGPGTLFVVDFAPRGFRHIAPATFDWLSGFARAGGRIVVTLPSIQGRDSGMERLERERERRARERERARRPGEKAGTNRADRAAQRRPFWYPEQDREEEEKPDGDARKRSSLVSLCDRWGFEVAFSTQEVSVATAAADAPPASTPPADAIPWHSSAYFEPKAPVWRTAWARDGKPVVIERPWLGGSIVLASDSYPLSNEAILRHRHAGFLAWLAGAGPAVWFDEYHFGIQEQPGLLAFARRFRLGGILAALLLLAGLFIWRNASSLLPPSDDAGDDARPRPDGFESRDGFVNLLRRHVPPSTLGAVCLREWKRTIPAGDVRLTRRAAALEAALRDAGDTARHPVALYRKLQSLLDDRRKETP